MVFVTVVIRSYKRLEAVRALVAQVLGQQEVTFEVLVVDSTPGLDAGAVLRGCSNGDPRVRAVWCPPRGCAAAANVGMREARGEVVAFVDDDDLPVGDRWLAAHARAYRDPRCLGVNGRMDYTGEGPPRVPRIRAGWLRDRWMLSYGPFKKPRVFPGSPTRKVGIEWLTGGNSSLRREVWERAGGWDEFLRYHNEHSLFLRLARVRRPGEYLLYEPGARMLIRRDVPGGLDHRTEADLQARVDTLARYYFWLVGRYHPVRIYGLLPVFLPYFVFDAGVHAAELAEHTGAGLLGAFWQGVSYAPRSAARHLFSPRA